MKSSLLLCGLLACGAFADGPYWQIPNPDSGSEEDIAADEAANDDGRKKGLIIPRPRDFRHNPGRFVYLDDKAREYFARHCAIRRDLGPTEFYLQLVHRSAQAMREVNPYEFPTDCFPMWLTEPDRELMVKYAMRVWELAGQLPPETARPCAELAVECYIDTIRFKQELNSKDSIARKYNSSIGRQREFAAKPEQLKEYNKMMAGLQEWLKTVITQYKTFAPWNMTAPGTVTAKGWYSSGITGDIPLQGDEAESRMAEALQRMGYVAVPALERKLNHSNKSVAAAVRALYERIRGKPTAMTYAGVLDHVKTVARLTEAAGIREEMASIKAIGMPAATYLARILYHEDEKLRPIAAQALKAITGKDFGLDPERWKAYIAKYEKEEAEKAARAAKEAKLPAPKKKSEPAADAEEEREFKIGKRPPNFEEE